VLTPAPGVLRRAPPSTRSSVPVTKEARSLSSQAAASAISSGAAPRRSGVSAVSRSCSPGDSASQARIISVSVLPGAIALTRMPSGP
jgi:hypothetical protein